MSGELGPPGGPGNVDLSFPREWREQLWGHHLEKLVPEPPSGVAFAGDLRALGSLPISLRNPGEDPARGAAFHFLAPGCAAEAYSRPGDGPANPYMAAAGAAALALAGEDGLVLTRGEFEVLDMPRCRARAQGRG